jgi:hypothetical protein
MDSASARSSIFAGSSSVAGRLYAVIKSMAHYKARQSCSVVQGLNALWSGRRRQMGARVGRHCAGPRPNREQIDSRSLFCSQFEISSHIPQRPHSLVRAPCLGWAAKKSAPHGVHVPVYWGLLFSLCY